MKEVIGFGVLFEFVLDLFESRFIIGLGGIEVEELVDEGGELLSLLGEMHEFD